MKDIFKVLKHIRHLWPIGLLASLMMAVFVFGEYLQPLFMSEIIEEAVKTGDTNVLWNIVAKMLITLSIMFVAIILNNIFTQYVAQYGAAIIREKLFKKIQSFSLKNVDSFSESKLITILTNDVMQIQSLLQMLFTMMLRSPLMIIFGIYFAVRLSADLSIVFVILTPIMLLGVILIMWKVVPMFSKIQKTVDGINQVVGENVHSARVVKSFGMEEHENKRFSKLNDKFAKLQTSASRLIGLSMPLIFTLMYLGNGLILIFGAILIEKGVLVDANGVAQTGTIMAFFTYTSMVLFGLIMLAMVFTFIARAVVSSKRINSVLDTKSDMESGNVIVGEFKGEFEFKNVGFKYHSSGNLVLKDISFKILPKQTIGIVGSTGSGKSSLVSLFARLYDVSKGEILIDGIPINTYDENWLREQIALVTQKAEIFKGTIRSNLLQGNELATDADFIEATKSACAYEYISKFDKMFDHEVEAKGANLSGGQKQRLAISRALIKKPKVLILDDSTSAVDSKTEQKIKNYIAFEKENMTTIIVAQKISTVKDADQIIVLNNYGCIDGVGTHEYLLSNSKVYQEINESQQGGLDYE